MQIVFDRASLRLRVDADDPLHEEALETWREASALAKTCNDALPAAEAATACQYLAEITTHALTAGRDDRVIAGFRKVEQQIRGADKAREKENFDNALGSGLIQTQNAMMVARATAERKLAASLS